MIIILTKYILAIYSKDLGSDASYTKHATSQRTSAGIKGSETFLTSTSCRIKYFSWPYTCTEFTVNLAPLSSSAGSVSYKS